jgi:hypothetical protein
LHIYFLESLERTMTSQVKVVQSSVL